MKRTPLAQILFLFALFLTIPLSGLDLLKNDKVWNPEKWEGNSVSFKQTATESVIDFKMPVEGQWVQVWKEISVDPDTVKSISITYLYAGNGHTLEIKLVDEDGSTFGKRFELTSGKNDWTEESMSISDFIYFWGGDKTLNHITKIYAAISGTGDGSLKIRKFEVATSDQPKEPEKKGTAPLPETKTPQSDSAGKAENLLDSTVPWKTDQWEGNSITFKQSTVESVMDFKMPVQGQWVQMVKDINHDASEIKSLTFGYKYKGSGHTLEIKLVDDDGSVFGKRIDLVPGVQDWTTMTLALSDLAYFWGGDKTLGHVSKVYFAISGTGDGTLGLNKIILTIGQAPSAVDVTDESEFEDYTGELPASKYWNNPKDWIITGDNESKVKITSIRSKLDYGLKVKYALRKGSYGYVEFKKNLSGTFDPEVPVTFWIKAKADSDLELKFVDKDGSIFIRKVPLKDAYKNWTQVVLYLNNTEYGWGGKDDQFNGWGFFQFALSGFGQGTVYLDGVGFGKKGMKASFSLAGPVIDPNATMPGTGFKQRRDAVMKPEDPLVLENLKQIQDISSPAKQILPSMENNEAQTFNNALVAMAFILKGEKERAERILDFFAAATNRKNDEINRQNFYYDGEPRGFFQWVELNDTENAEAFHYSLSSKTGPDRWMGDMSWLMLAYNYYSKQYDPKKYAPIMKIMKDYLVSLYTNASDGPGGYLRHGWINGDRKHNENFGHPEGNIDAWVVMKQCGENTIADNIRKWLDTKLKGNSLPLDLYTWRVLAFGSDFSNVLNIPEYDLRYRKTLNVKGHKAMGLYPFGDYNVDNIWFDGTGHIACAYFSCGNPQRGNFYSDQLDEFLIDRKINNVATRSLPYMANTTGEYSWVDTKKGFISAAAWYIFAKNRFNPYYGTQSPAK